jgi:ParB family chromosome partitioning protein
MTRMQDSGRSAKTRKLGRGLSSLIGDPVPVMVGSDEVGVSEHKHTVPGAVSGEGGPGLRMLDVGLIEPSPFQPRRAVESGALEGLAASIRRSGVMQPIVVRAVGGRYELVAGERRWRAAMAAGLDRVPASVRDLSDEESAEWALVENLQREDLNPVERASAFQTLSDRFGLTHGEVADRVGLERSTVANEVRLLELEGSITSLISSGLLSGGHGKALLSVLPGPGRERLAAHAARAGWSVRRLEREAREMTPGAPLPQPRAERSDLERQLSEHLGTKVKVRTDASGKRGRLTIEFYGLDHFDGLMARLGFQLK